jgi:demethylmenaquinone methyltransferase/2-methoxy-6-polyprenyl-1,4-benzoquinol methylase
MSLTENVARYYSARAEEYDVSAGYTDMPAEELRAPIKARFQDALKGHDVLEIACGTGYWTEAIAASANRVLATDIDPGMISIARRRLSSLTNVRCQVADAYSLHGVPGGFTAAFAHWWWSHIPKSRIRSFLTVLHSRLIPGAQVLFADQLPYDWRNFRYDEEGNRLEVRTLGSGARFEIVKNFPSEQEIIDGLSGIAEGIVYREYPEGQYWTLTYKVA